LNHSFEETKSLNEMKFIYENVKLILIKIQKIVSVEKDLINVSLKKLEKLENLKTINEDVDFQKLLEQLDK
jgi:hypothetical protein